MAGVVWIDGAERLNVAAPGGTITSTAPPRVVWHTVEASAGTRASWQNMIRVLNGKVAEPQVLYDPVKDWLGQFMGLNLSGRALKNDGSTKTNRVGKVCIQIEVMGYAAHPFTTGWSPGPNFRKLLAAIRSWGVPDTWPAGPPPRFIDNPPHNVPENPRNRSTWLTKGGHYGHSQIPANSHGDPGAISVSALFSAGGTAAPATAPASAAPKVTGLSTGAMQYAAHNPNMSGVWGGQRAQAMASLHALGCTPAIRPPAGTPWDVYFRAAWKKWQIKCGYTGNDADGYPGDQSVDKLCRRVGLKHLPK